MNKRYAVFCIIWLVCVQAFSQTKDSVVHTPITAWHIDQYATSKTQVAMDTMHATFFETMPNARLSDYKLDLGSFGSPAFSLKFAPLSTQPFFYHAFESSSARPNTMLIYNTPRPYTELYYSGAQYQQQQVSVLHTQNYSKDLNIGARLHYYKTMGEYTPQSYSGKHIAPWVAYNGSKFSLYFKYAFNSYVFDVNGGILDDSLISKKNFIMSLQNASSHITNHNAHSTIKWNISKKPMYRDSSSIALYSYPVALGYSLRHTSYSFNYTHTNLPTNWYTKTLWDTIQTLDTNRVSQTENVFFVELSGKNSSITHHSVFAAAYQYNHSYMRNYDFSYPHEFSNSVYINADCNFEVPSHDVQLEYNHTYYVWGDYANDNIANLKLTKSIDYSIDKAIEVSADYSYTNAKPRNMYPRYISNHYNWDNNFTEQQIHHISFAALMPAYNTSITISKYYLKQYLYFNTKGTIMQANEPAQAFVASLNKETKVWKFLLNNSLLLQTNSTSGLDYPVWATYNSIAFRNVFYKKLIDTYIGLEALYYPKYNVPQYNTALNTFTQQFDKEIGDFPHVNAFISIKYKPIRCMVSYTGLYASLFGKQFTALHYPQQTGYVSFAVSWLFYN